LNCYSFTLWEHVTFVGLQSPYHSSESTKIYSLVVTEKLLAK